MDDRLFFFLCFIRQHRWSGTGTGWTWPWGCRDVSSCTPPTILCPWGRCGPSFPSSVGPCSRKRWFYNHWDHKESSPKQKKYQKSPWLSLIVVNQEIFPIRGGKQNRWMETHGGEKCHWSRRCDSLVETLGQRCKGQEHDEPLHHPARCLSPTVGECSPFYTRRQGRASKLPCLISTPLH